MKKFLGLVMCALFVAAGVLFVACSDDEDDDETTDYGAAAAIAKIKASSETFAGVSDFSALTFADFSNETNDPIILREEDANGNYTYSIASADTVTEGCFSKVGIVKAKDVALWSSEKYGSFPRGQINTNFSKKTKKFQKLKENGNWINKLPTSGTIDLSLVKDFIALKATGAGTISASITNYSITVDTGVAALIDSTGKILDSVKLTAKSDTVTPTEQTLSATVPSSGVYMLIISKNESGGGTVIINSFIFTPSSNSGTGTPVGTYKGTVTKSGKTVYMILTINSNNTWSSKGYTDATYSTPTNVGTDSGTYTQSGNSITLTGTVASNEVGTTSDNWNTVIVSGGSSGTLTRQ